MTREQFYTEAWRHMVDEFASYIAKQQSIMRANKRTFEEIEAATECSWRTFEQERERLLEESWQRFSRTYH